MEYLDEPCPQNQCTKSLHTARELRFYNTKTRLRGVAAITEQCCKVKVDARFDLYLFPRTVRSSYTASDQSMIRRACASIVLNFSMKDADGNRTSKRQRLSKMKPVKYQFAPSRSQE